MNSTHKERFSDYELGKAEGRIELTLEYLNSGIINPYQALFMLVTWHLEDQIPRDFLKGALLKMPSVASQCPQVCKD